MSQAESIIALLERRINNREDALARYEYTQLDSVPADVLKLRELETQNIRLIIQEQKDLIETIKMMFTHAKDIED